jgi:hypothetical protein
VGGGTVRQRGDLLLGTHLPQHVQKYGQAERVVEGGVGGCAVAMKRSAFALVRVVVRGGVEPPTFRFPGGLPILKVSKERPRATTSN